MFRDAFALLREHSHESHLPDSFFRGGKSLASCEEAKGLGGGGYMPDSLQRITLASSDKGNYKWEAAATKYPFLKNKQTKLNQESSKTKDYKKLLTSWARADLFQ